MDELHARETALRGVLNATQESICLFSAGCVLRLANETALKRFGMPADEVIGKHVNDLLPPDLAKTRLSRLNDVVRTGNPVEFEDMRAGILFRHIFSPVFDSRGNVTDVAIYSRDITRQRENEARLASLASFPQLNPNPIIEADMTGRVTYANPSAYSTLARLGLSSTDTNAFMPADMNAILEAWDRKTPSTVDREVTIADRMFKASAYLDPGLGVARIYSYDSTESKRAEDKLKKSAEETLQRTLDSMEQRVEERTRELRSATDSVRTERQRLYSVLETLPVYVILLDKDYRIPFANRFFRQRFGESGGRRCYEYLFNRAEPCDTCETYTVLKTNSPHHWHWTGPDKRSYDIYDYPFLDSDGSALILEMGIDITDQKHAQEALRATIEEIKLTERRTVLINELLLLFTREPERDAFLDAAIGLIKEWSGLRHVGIRVADNRGNIPYASCVGFSDEFLESERTLCLDRDHCTCTRVVRGMPEPQDLPAMTDGGSFFSNNTARFIEDMTGEQRARFRGVCIRTGFLSLAVIPVRYRDKVLGAIHVADEQEGMVPYTAVEFLEQVALIIGEALFRFGVEQERFQLAAAVASAADAVVVTEPERGAILYVNDAFERMTGYARGEAVGKDLHILDSGRHDAAFYEDLRAALRRDGVWRGRLINMKKDGTLYFEDCTFSPVRDHSGRIVNFVSVRRDVTEKLRLESIAESVSTLDNMGAVFAGVRHEIGNPINNAKIHLSVLKQRLDSLPAERVREYVDRTLGEISRVEQLLHTLKTFNLFETPVLEDVATGPLLELFRGLVREDLESRGIALLTQILPGAERIRGNARALQHVLLNLTNNAVDAVTDRPDPHIDIMLSREDDRVRIRVSDNGCGMNKDHLASLFKPFHTTKQHGTGLGLVIVKKMLTTMRGTIHIASHEGSGTVVTVHLPGGTHV